jgi:hypothetical protein
MDGNVRVIMHCRKWRLFQLRSVERDCVETDILAETCVCHVKLYRADLTPFDAQSEGPHSPQSWHINMRLLNMCVAQWWDQGRWVRDVDEAPFIFGTKGISRKLRGSKYWTYVPKLNGCSDLSVLLWETASVVSGQSSWLQIRRPGFDFRHYQKKK